MPYEPQKAAGHELDLVPPTPVSGDRLGNARREAYWKIDKRTRELIALGFAHASKRFSLSARAQSYWIGLRVALLAGSFTDLNFPLTVSTIDDVTTHVITSSTEAATMYAVAVGTLRTRLDSGTSLKDQVRAATTVAEVLSVVDTR